MTQRAVFSTVLALLVGCSPTVSSTTAPSSITIHSASTMVDSTTSLAVVADWIKYTEDALSVLEEDYLFSDRIDWEAIREAALGRVRSSPSPNAAHQALRDAMASFNDAHTYFQAPMAAAAENENPFQLPEGRMLLGGLGYLLVPSMVGDGPAMVTYATELHEAMRGIAETGPVCGWVVDLRENGGGNIHGMLLGLAPLLGEGALVTYRSTVETTAFEYRERSLYVGEATPYLTLKSEPFVPADPSLPVAVLISNQTASAAEGVLVAFIGRPSTRTFGTATSGIPTSPRWHQLPDGAYLVFTYSAAEDRNGQVYKSQIDPDERLVDLFPEDGDDVVLSAAARWLMDQAACS